MKKKRYILTSIVVIVMVLIFISYHFFTALKVTNESITVVNYKSIPVTEEYIERINERNLECEDYCDIWDLKKLPTKNYGNLFEVFYNMDYKRYNRMNDYYITKKVDFSDLSEEEKVFFVKINGFSDTFLFDSEEREDWTTASNCVYLEGITYGKSREELEKIIRKVKITLVFQDKNGKIFEKNVSVLDSPINWEKESDYDIEGAKDIFEEKVEE